MGNIFSTSRTKNRVIAFVMAMLLALTPVISNVGEGGVKADDAAKSVSVNAGIKLSPTLSLDESGKVTCSEPQKINIRYASVIDEVVLSDTSVSSDKITEICFTETEDANSITPDTQFTGSITTSTIGEAGKTIYAYAKITDNASTPDAPYYVKIATINVAESSVKIENPKFTQTNNTILVTGVTGDTTEDATILGTVKYGYVSVKEDANNTILTSYSDYADSLVAAWSEDSTAPTTEGKYVGFVGIFNGDTLLTEEPQYLGSFIIDKTPPTIGDVVTVEFDGKTLTSDVESSKVSETKKIKISTTVTDTDNTGNTGSGVSSVVLKKKITDNDNTGAEDTNQAVGTFTKSTEENNNTYTLELSSALSKDDSYEIVATDANGNEAKKDLPYKVTADQTPPTVSFSSLTSTALKEGKTYSNADITTTMYVTKDSELTVSASDLSGIAKVEYFVGDSTTASKVVTSDFGASVKMSDILKDKDDGTYTIKVVATDTVENRNLSNPLSFTVIYDNAKPVVTVSLVKKTDSTWTPIDIDSLKDGTYYINNSESEAYQDNAEYAYRVVVEDANVKADSLEVQDTGNIITTKSPRLTAVKDENGKYEAYLSIDKSKLNSASLASISATAKDLLGNESDPATANISLKAVSSDITVSELKLTDDKDTEVAKSDYEKLKAGTNKTYTATFTVTSPCELSEVALVYSQTDSDGKTKTGKIEPAKTSFEYDEDVQKKLKIYQTTVTLTIPAEAVINGEDKTFLYTDLYLEVTPKDSDTYSVKKTTDLLTLLYDKNSPVVTIQAKNVSGDNVAVNTWVNNATVTISAVSGNGLYESDMDNESYTIAEATANVEAKSGEKTVSVSNVTLPESTTLAGTKVSAVATDKAGNVTASEDYIYLIDATSPTVNYLTVNNENSFTIPLTGNPEIKFSISDNLTLGEVSISVSYDGETPKIITPKFTELTAESKTDEFEITLTDIVEKASGSQYAPDGTYTITINAKDKAGNVATAKSITFGLDNTAPDKPVVTLQQNKGTTENPVWVDYTGCYIDTVNHYNYRYKITNVKDVNGNLSDVASETVKVAAGSTWTSTGRTGTVSRVTEGGETFYTYEFDTSDKESINRLSGASTYVSYIMVKDRSGNVSTPFSTTGLKKLNTSINIGEASLRDAGGNVKKFGDTNLAVNSTYKLYIDAESGYPLSTSNISLRKVATDSSQPDTEFKLNSASSFEAETDGRYTSRLVFDIPGAALTGVTNLNELYRSITLYVTDAGEYKKSVTLGKLVFDNTHPYVNVLEYSTATWVKEKDATLTYELVSGSDSVESILSRATYTLAGNTVDITPSAARTTGRRSVAMPETTDPTKGTTITFAATDNAGNNITNLGGTKPYSVTMFVDGHNPEVTSLSVDGLSSVSVPLSGVPRVSTAFSDNLTLARVDVLVTYPDGNTKTYTKSYAASDGIGVDVSDNYSFYLESTDNKAADGDYQVSVKAYDKAGNESAAKTISFRVDNTKPVVALAISGGTQGGKQPRADGTDYYYRSNVTVSFEVEETNFTSSGVTVTDKLGNSAATPVSVSWTKVGDRYVGVATISAEGAHVVSISATDMTGNKADGKSITFCVDKTAPTVSLTLAGLSYDESRGVVYLTSDVAVTAAVADMTEDAGDLNIQIIRTRPDQSAETPDYVKTAGRSFGFSEEADYIVNFYAVDMAGNRSATRTVTFRVDKTVPDLSISGTAGGGTSANATSVTFTMKEAFWWDASGQVSIYQKAGDGKEEALYKTLELKPTAFQTALTENLTETGTYRFEFTGTDKSGHTIETSQTFTIDREAPVVTLYGVNNYDITEDNVQFTAQVEDDFYSSKKVTINGSVTDIDGRKKTINFGSYNQAGNPTVISQEFSDDGIYDIEVTSVDAAGNSHSSKVHFTIDKTAPEIGDLSDYDGTIIKAFNWDIDLDELVSDLTVCDTHMYLNGSEYDGISDIEDGSYTLLITSEDEMGHSIEKSVSFVLDTKAPVFIVTGVEDGEVKNETYSIGVSLQLSEDTLKEVTLNGSPVDISDNTASLTVDSKGDYVLTMRAVDEAGNEAVNQISFTYGVHKSAWWVWLIIGLGVCAIGFAIIITVKKNNQEN